MRRRDRESARELADRYYREQCVRLNLPDERTERARGPDNPSWSQNPRLTRDAMRMETRIADAYRESFGDADVIDTAASMHYVPRRTK